MLESKRTSILLSRLRKRTPSWFVWKINDRSTGGLADSLSIGPRRHVWTEFKRCKPTQNPQDFLSALQKRTLTALQDLCQSVLVVGLHEDGSQSVYFLGNDYTELATSKTAYRDVMERLC